MEDFWRRVWLYARMSLIVLIVVFIVQFLLTNAIVEGSARVVFWEDSGSNIAAVFAAFVLGALLYPIWRLGRQAYRDFKQERAQRHEQAAERAWQEAKARGETPVESSGAPVPTEQEGQGPAEQEWERAPSPQPAEPERSAADVWTSGEEHGEDAPREQN